MSQSIHIQGPFGPLVLNFAGPHQILRAFGPRARLISTLAQAYSIIPQAIFAFYTWSFVFSMPCVWNIWNQIFGWIAPSSMLAMWKATKPCVCAILIPIQWLLVTDTSVSSHVVTVQLRTRCLVDRFLHKPHYSGYLILCLSDVFTVQWSRTREHSDYIFTVVVTVPSRWLMEQEFCCVFLKMWPNIDYQY